MRSITVFLCCIFIISCNTGDSKKQIDSLKQWILTNQEQLNLTSDSIIQDYQKKMRQTQIGYHQA